MHPRPPPPFYSNSNHVQFSSQFQNRPHFQIRNGISSKPEATLLKPPINTSKETEATQLSASSLSRGTRHYPGFAHAHIRNPQNHPRPIKVVKLLVVTPFFKISKDLQFLLFPRGESSRPEHNSYEYDHDADHYYDYGEAEEDYNPFAPVPAQISYVPVKISDETEGDDERDLLNHNYFHLQDLIKPAHQEKTEDSADPWKGSLAHHLYHPSHHPGHIYAPSMIHQKYQVKGGESEKDRSIKNQKYPLALTYAPNMDHTYYNLSKNSIFSRYQKQGVK